MRLTENRLRQIIREELQSLQEGAAPQGYDYGFKGTARNVFDFFMKKYPEYWARPGGLSKITVDDFSDAWSDLEQNEPEAVSMEHPSVLSDMIYQEMPPRGIDDPEGMEDLPMGDDV